MKRNIWISLAAVFAAIFLFSAVMLWHHYADQKQSAEAFNHVASLVQEETQPTQPTDSTEPSGEAETEPTEPAMTAYEKYAEVYAQNNDFVGWLSIDGTNINYPVMQTVDNPDYYLKRGFDKAYSDYGVPYVQENCVLGISDNMVIYGHNMKNGSMFADLCKYQDADFHQEHKTIQNDKDSRHHRPGFHQDRSGICRHRTKGGSRSRKNGSDCGSVLPCSRQSCRHNRKGCGEGGGIRC